MLGKTELFQTKKKGMSVKVVSQYAHAKVAANEISISPGSVSLSIGNKYDQSAEKTLNIKN